MAKVGKLAATTSPLLSISTEPLTETPDPSIAMSSMRVFAFFRDVIVKVARAGLVGALIQPGSRLSIFTWVRSASIANRLSWSLEAGILPPSRTGTGPLSAPLKSKPNLQAPLALAVVAHLPVVDLRRHAADADVAARRVAVIVGGDAQRLRLDALR